MNDEQDFLIIIGARIKGIRIEKKMSQQKCASICDFEKSNLSRIESGRTNPTLLTLRKISIALEVKLSELLDHR